MKCKRIMLFITLCLLLNAGVMTAQDSLSHRMITNKSYTEAGWSLGYNLNFSPKTENDKTPEKFHFIELGLWKSTVTLGGHHPFITTHYVASDFGLNASRFMIGPKAGGFLSVMPMGIGGEFCYYTDFTGGSLRFIPYIGIITPSFKMTFNPHVVLTNKEFNNLNRRQVSFTALIKWKRSNR